MCEWVWPVCGPEAEVYVLYVGSGWGGCDAGDSEIVVSYEVD